jgi:hypothetical protein
MKVFKIILLCCLLFCMGNPQIFAQEKDKPVIRNYLRVKGILKEDTSIFAQPYVNSSEIDKCNQYSILFIFYPGNGYDLTRDDFYRVGKEPDRPIGWVPKSMIREWDHRLCLHFTPLVGREPALVYRDKNAVAKALRSSVIDRSDAIAEEPGDIAKNRYSMLMPVLSKYTVTTGGEVRQAYQTGYLAGGASFATKSDTFTVSNNNKELAILELMFVIDATLSMQAYISATKQVIASTAKHAQEMNETGVRVGLLCYRDYIKNHPEMEFVTKLFSPLTKGFSEVINILNDVKSSHVSSEDYPEAVFDGLYAAITETNWDKKKSSLRVVVLVGDASGHPSRHNKNPMNYSLQQLIQTASDNRVRIVAIKIKSDNDRDNIIHQYQWQSLARGLSAGDCGSYHEIADHKEYVSQLTAQIENEIANLKILARAVKRPDIFHTLPTDTKAIILKDLKPQNTGAQKAGFAEGWICEKNPNGKLQVVPHVFMSFDDFALNIFYLQTASILAKTPTEGIQRSVTEIVRTETGEAWQEGESLSDHYQKKFGLPAMSKLLRFNMQEIIILGEQRKMDILKTIQRKVKVMEAHRDNPENWYKTGKKNFHYTFVPLDYLP